MKNKFDINIKMNLTFTNILGACVLVYACTMSAIMLSADSFQAPFWVGVALILGRVVGEKVATGITDKINFSAKSKIGTKCRE